ncbi:MAG TPA: hypothetical protein V6C91_01655 [Coleofasciculaceae cyanobacterium]
MHEEEARAIFQAKGTFRGTPEEWKEVIQHKEGSKSHHFQANYR